MKIILSLKIYLNEFKKIREKTNINFTDKDILFDLITNFNTLIIIQKMTGIKNIIMNLIKNKNQNLLMRIQNFRIFLIIKNL